MAQRSVYDIRKEVESSVGKEVILKADMGRKRVKRTVSYTYSDILTSTVKLTTNK